ncbi:hypothetical protein Ddye_004445 [Dipteronia dyeriana]|uniref:Uncharacterized protein n=1 Tax=Dipteronia dyeriana TaxID=168575 RepID=A0AAD9XUU8_9ROSI|nr:hypothetical protein Ddye_004445 [Dipteronia dyeriana]
MEFLLLTKKGKKNHEEIRTFQISSTSLMEPMEAPSRGIAPSRWNPSILTKLSPILKAKGRSSMTCTPPTTPPGDESTPSRRTPTTSQSVGSADFREAHGRIPAIILLSQDNILVFFFSKFLFHSLNFFIVVLLCLVMQEKYIKCIIMHY